MCCEKPHSHSQYKTIVINSADRASGTSSEFVVNLPQQLESVEEVKLLNIQLPNSLYNITSSNNTLVINDGIGNSTIVIAPGAYTTSTLSAALVAGLNAAFANAFVVNFDTLTLKTTISGTNPFSLILSQSTINTVLGFDNTDTASANTHTGQYAYNLGIPTPIYVKINEMSMPLISSDGFYYLFCMQVNENSIEFVNYNINTNFVQQHVVNVSGMSRLTVSLRSRGNTPVDLLGLDWNMTIQVKQRRPN